jgi:ABC-type phosphate transport system substrate-binding protein
MKQFFGHRRHALGYLFVAMFILGSASSNAQVSIVVSKSSSWKASGAELKQMFEGVKLTWEGGDKVEVVDQSETSVGATFYKSFLGKTLMQVHNDWSRLVLTGQASAPKRVGSDDAVKKAVAGNSNAIGYIATSSLDNSVREIYRVIGFSRSE